MDYVMDMDKGNGIMIQGIYPIHCTVLTGRQRQDSSQEHDSPKYPPLW